MASNNHGGAILHTQGTDRLDYLLQASNGSDALIIGQNHQPSEDPLSQPDANELDHTDIGISWNPSKLRGHSFFMGANRQGKGTGIIIPWLLSARNNFVVADFKSEAAAITGKYRRNELGHRVVILDPTDETNRQFISKMPGEPLEVVTKYNPLTWIDPASNTFPDDVSSVLEALAPIEGSDPYWSRGGRDLNIGLTAAEILFKGVGKASFRGVRKALAMADEEFAAHCTTICQMFPDSLAALKLGRFQSVSNANGSIKGVAAQQMGFLDSTDLMNSMDTDANPFNWRDLEKPGVTVYICCPADRVETYAPWLRLCVQDAMRQLMRNRPALDLPVTFILDELPVLGPMAIIKQAYGVASGMGICCAGFVQDISQLKAMYPQDWQTFTGNSAVVGILAARGDTAKWVSEQLGNETVETVQRSKNTGESDTFSQGGGSQGQSSGESENHGEMGKPIMDPYQVEKMDERLMIALFPGHDNYILRKLNYYTDKRFFGRYRPDPHYPVSTQTSCPYSVAELRERLRIRRGAVNKPANPQPSGATAYVRDFLTPAVPYSGPAKLGIYAALALWFLMLYSMWIQAGSYGFRPFPYIMFFASAGLCMWLLKDNKHRAAVIGVSLLFLFVSYQGTRNMHGALGVFTGPMEGLYNLGLRHFTLLELLWPLFLLDARFRQLVHLAWLNGYTRQGKLVTVVYPFKSFGERLLLGAEAFIFVCATVKMSFGIFGLVAGIHTASATNPHGTPVWLAATLVLASFVQCAAALFLFRPMLLTFGRASLTMKDVKGINPRGSNPARP